MWQILALSLTIMGVITIYLTNKHQGFILKPLPKQWRIVGYLSWLLSLAAWLQIHVLSAALFIWFFTLSSILVCIPLLSLLITFDKRKPANKGKT